MKSFSATYKKAFKEFLYPQGYKLWKGLFYKETENVCIFIRAKKSRYNAGFEMQIEIMPYCADMKAMEYEPDEGYDSLIFYRRLMPDMLIVDPDTKSATKEFEDFYMARFVASDDETMLSSLNTIRGDMENLILPYIHRFSDLKYCYNELFMIKRIRDHRDAEEIRKSHLKDDSIYGLSLKLHEYENALVYVESKLRWHRDLKEKSLVKLVKLREGRFVDTIGDGWSLEDRQKLAKSMLRKDPNHIKWLIGIKEKMIAESEEAIRRFETIKEALLSNNTIYIDKLVAETEESSKEYIRQMIYG